MMIDCWRVGRVAYGTVLERRRSESFREFESHALRHVIIEPTNVGFFIQKKQHLSVTLFDTVHLNIQDTFQTVTLQNYMQDQLLSYAF